VLAHAKGNQQSVTMSLGIPSSLLAVTIIKASKGGLMKNLDCVQFLQWALPRLQMRWPGYRKVRRRICKRIDRRMQQLMIEELAAYRTYLEAHPAEWRTLDTLCPVTISRFYRDKAVFSVLEQQLIPNLIRQAIDRGQRTLKVWSAGCASGEEAYTIALIWQLQLQQHFPGFELEILATDLDPAMGKRIAEACYPHSSIRYLPELWRYQAFMRQQNLYSLKPEYRYPITFRVQDIRCSLPSGRFDLVLCRNLVFTYFSTELQRQVTEQINKVIQPGGALVIGCHESLPERTKGFEVWYEPQRIFQKTADW